MKRVKFECGHCGMKCDNLPGDELLKHFMNLCTEEGKKSARIAQIVRDHERFDDDGGYIGLDV